MKQWEKEIREKRKEFKKSLPHLEDKKKDLIINQLLEKPLISLEELDQSMKENGMLGLSLKEKIIVLRKQMSLLVVQYMNYQKKKEKLNILIISS